MKRMCMADESAMKLRVPALPWRSRVLLHMATVKNLDQFNVCSVAIHFVFQFLIHWPHSLAATCCVWREFHEKNSGLNWLLKRARKVAWSPMNSCGFSRCEVLMWNAGSRRIHNSNWWWVLMQNKSLCLNAKRVQAPSLVPAPFESPVSWFHQQLLTEHWILGVASR